MKLIIQLTTFTLIITQLLMLHAQGYKEKKNGKHLDLTDEVRMGEVLTRHKRDENDKKERDNNDINNDRSNDYSLGSQGTGTRRRTDDVSVESTPRRFNFGINSNLLGNTGRGNLQLDYIPPDYVRYLGILRDDILRRRGAGNSGQGLGAVVNGVGKMLDGGLGTVVGGLDTTLGHVSDAVGELLGANEPESSSGGLLGLGFLLDGLGKLVGHTLDTVFHGLVHNALQDTTHLAHELLNPDANRNVGGSIGFQGSPDDRLNLAIRNYLLQNGYYYR